MGKKTMPSQPSATLSRTSLVLSSSTTVAHHLIGSSRATRMYSRQRTSRNLATMSSLPSVPCMHAPPPSTRSSRRSWQMPPTLSRRAKRRRNSSRLRLPRKQSKRQRKLGRRRVRTMLLKKRELPANWSQEISQMTSLIQTFQLASRRPSRQRLQGLSYSDQLHSKVSTL